MSINNVILLTSDDSNELQIEINKIIHKYKCNQDEKVIVGNVAVAVSWKAYDRAGKSCAHYVATLTMIEK
jgi:hypothetical protein